MLPTDIGYKHNMETPGYLTTPGDGPHSIMDVGFMMIFMAGFGFRIQYGAPHGLTGGKAMVIMDGAH